MNFFQYLWRKFELHGHPAILSDPHFISF